MKLGPHPPFSWSVSRARLFGFCPRKYYYRYYGMWGGWKETAEERRRLCYLLSRRTSLASWAGQEVHRSIASYLSSSQSIEQVIQQTRERMREQFRCSRSRVWSKPGQAKQFGLLEHYYYDVLDDEVVRQRWEHVQTCLESMNSSGYLQDVQKARESGRLVYVENPKEMDFEQMGISGHGLGDFRVFAQPDFIVEYEDGTTCIIDWKTGRSPSHGLDQLTEQLSLYALWASEKLHLDPSCAKVEAYEVYLPAHQSKGDTIQAHSIEAALEYVKNSVIELMSVLKDSKSNVAQEQDFTPHPSVAKCASCEFRAICPDKAAD